MSTARLKLTIEHADGEVEEITADQRDMVIVESILKMGFPMAMRDRTVTTIRLVAYHSLKRQGLIHEKLPLEVWEDDIPIVRFEVVDAADPGKPGVREDSPSASPSRRAPTSGRSSSSGSPKTSRSPSST